MTMNLPPQADRILAARLHGTAIRHANRWWRAGDVDEREHHAAVAELRQLAAGRADLLAEVAGILEGFSEGDLYEVRGQMAAQLCKDAGADPDAIGRWAEVGRQRRADATGRRPPPV